MGRGHRHMGLWVALGLVALFMLLVTGVQGALNTRFARDRINSALASSIDGGIDYSRIDISLFRNFPLLRITIDTLSLTYGHDRFAEWDSIGAGDPLLAAGRGADRDTLASLDRITAAVNLWELVRGRMRLKDARVDGLAVFLHRYDTTASNLDIFKSDGRNQEKDTTKTSSFALSVKDVCLSGIRGVYTDRSSGTFASADAARISASGFVHVDEDGGFRVRRVNLAVDTLLAEGRIPENRASVAIERLAVEEVSRDMYDLVLKLDAFAGTGRYGDLSVPVLLHGRAGLSVQDGHMSVDVPELDGRIAHIPLHVEGKAGLYRDSTYVSGKAGISGCPLDTLLTEYAVKFADVAKDVRTDARADIFLSAEGAFTKRTMPAIKVSLKVPESRVRYFPLDVDGTLALDVDGSMSERNVIDATLHGLTARLPDIALVADGSVHDLLGWDPSFKVFADADADLEAVSRFIPASLGMVADGDMCLQLRADGRLSYIRNLEFGKGEFSASLKGDRIALRMPEDTLDASFVRPDLVAEMDGRGINISILSDSAYFSKGENLEGRIRRMDNKAVLTKLESRGRMTPYLDVDHVDKGISFRTGNNWFRLRNADICLSATREVRPVMDSAAIARMRSMRDSLRRRQSEADSDKVFRKNDIDISVDSTIAAYLRKWSPKAKIRLGRGSISMPVLPLRTGIGGLEGEFDGDKLTVDTLSARVGTSHLSLKGDVSGLRRALQRKGRLSSNINLYSRRLNVNELLAAFDVGRKNEGLVYPEADESFIVDSLQVDTLEVIETPLIVLPSNVDARIGVLVDQVDYSDFTVKPLSAFLTLKDRTLQLSEGRIDTELGDINLDAFYSARSRDDISAGFNLSVLDVSADSLIHLLPSVDSLMPVLKSFKGRLNCEASAMTQIDTNMNVIIPSLEGVLHISGSDLNVEDAGGIVKITKLLRFKNPNIGHIDDLDVNAVIHDSKLDVFPFILGVDRYRLALHGMQGLDKTMYYHASIIKSPFLVKLGINVFGTFDKWKFNIGLPRYKDANIPVFTKQIDTMRINIAKTIDNVFEQSVDELRNFHVAEELESRQRELGYAVGDAFMTGEQSAASEQLAFEYEAMLEEEELQAEVDAVLEDSFREIEDVMKDYETQVYERKIFRKMDRLARKQAKKSAKKNV